MNRETGRGGADTQDAAREAALRLLARREHARRELHIKLAARGFGDGAIDAALVALADAGLQSDARFAESFARQRAERCYGPRRIQAELAERGVDRALTQAVLAELEVDFNERARVFFERKYGGRGPADYRTRARWAQALYRRGFEREHIRGLADE